MGNAQRQTWPFLNQIRYATRIERALEQGPAHVAAELDAAAATSASLPAETSG